MADPHQQMWAGALAHVRQYYPTLCRGWFEALEPMPMDNGVLRVRTTSAVHRNYLQRECVVAFAEGLQHITGRLATIRFVSSEDEQSHPGQADQTKHHNQKDQRENAPPPFVRTPTPGRNPAMAPVLSPQPALPAAGREAVSRNDVVDRAVGGAVGRSHATPTSGLMPKPSPIRALRDDTGQLFNPDYTFDTFISGPENQLAYTAAQTIAENPAAVYNPLFIHGGVGLGKTHLLQAICIHVLQNRPDTIIHYISCEGFINRFMDAVKAGTMPNFRHSFRDVDLLIVDDIHFLAKMDRSQEEFFHTFNSLYQMRRQIVLSSDAKPDQIPHLEERLVSRFKQGLVAEVETPCFETRLEIVRTKVGMRGIKMDEDVCVAIARHTSSSVRELEGVILTLDARAQALKTKLTEDMVIEFLGLPKTAARPLISIQRIIDAVTEHFGCKTHELQSKRKFRSIVYPRQVAMYLARHHTRYSLKEIGGHFGGRDHSTVIYALDMIELRVKDTPACQADIEQLTRVLLQTPYRPTSSQ